MGFFILSKNMPKRNFATLCRFPIHFTVFLCKGGGKMYKYKFITLCGVTLEFESKYHITQLTPVTFDDVTFIRFEDNEFVIKLTEVKEVWINGIKHQLRAYAI